MLRGRRDNINRITETVCFGNTATTNERAMATRTTTPTHNPNFQKELANKMKIYKFSAFISLFPKWNETEWNETKRKPRKIFRLRNGIKTSCDWQQWHNRDRYRERENDEKRKKAKERRKKKKNRSLLNNGEKRIYSYERHAFCISRIWAYSLFLSLFIPVYRSLFYRQTCTHILIHHSTSIQISKVIILLFGYWINFSNPIEWEENAFS